MPAYGLRRRHSSGMALHNTRLLPAKFLLFSAITSIKLRPESYAWPFTQAVASVVNWTRRTPQWILARSGRVVYRRGSGPRIHNTKPGISAAFIAHPVARRAHRVDWRAFVIQWSRPATRLVNYVVPIIELTLGRASDDFN
ncbi:hypothetical protein EVAR_95150_1 [Eumeta japonica]|uniref:Uncharacterized protein n=1 Tax=Eumeta variegata TaxID=151549 RepID=A0A4C1W6B6_EUMVA|nr:hypothetical protein EVAR_95150_1 [Eumeta japonica]